MGDHHESSGLAVTNDPQFGKASAENRTWIFLVTDAMSFSGFLIAYAVVRSIKERPNPAEHWVLISPLCTFLLICSSVSMVLSIDGCKRKDRKYMPPG